MNVITEQRLAEIEEWIGTPESFLLSSMAIEEDRKRHEQQVSQAITELIAEVRELQEWKHDVIMSGALDYAYY